jgi:glycerol-3-phosphate acyltransferase PlsY
MIVWSIVGVIASYALGSIPTGLWLGQRLRGIDIREHGSKNIGATNTMRVLGKKLGAIALACDIAKGLIPVLIAQRYGEWAYLPIVCGVAAILGHTFSFFVNFKGGKGVATSAGVFMGLAPLPMLVAVVVFGLVLALTRMVSAGSILAATAMTISVFLLPTPFPIQVLTVVVALLVIYKHRTNIQRILAGNESKI